MKTLAFFTLAVLCAAPVLASEPSLACAAKRGEIESRITQAQAHNNRQELAGLQKALQANLSNCTPESLAAQREADISQARSKLAEREKDLTDAKHQGDRKKIARRQAKLDEARSDLAKAEKSLPGNPSS